MYHSYLVVDVGSNPDRPRPGRNWLSNIYNVHQRLCMGFPSKTKLQEDPYFLAPFIPDYFTTDNNEPFTPIKSDMPLSKMENKRPFFLFRIENQISDNKRIAIICVQSELEPNWNYAFRNAMHLLDSSFPISAPIRYNPDINSGDILNFRINVNLSKKISKKNSWNETRENFDKIQGKRISVIWNNDENRDIVIRKWFENKAERGNLGFSIKEFNVVKIGWTLGWKHIKNQSHPSTLRFRSALLEGKLEVTNKENFEKTLNQGIGSAKAFGFGLLSV